MASLRLFLCRRGSDGSIILMWLFICLCVAAGERLYARHGSIRGNGSLELPFWSLAAALETTQPGPTELLVLGPDPLLVVQLSDQLAFGDSLLGDLLVR